MKKRTISRLGSKFIRHNAIVMLLSILISFGIAFALFWPRLQKNAALRADTANVYIAESVNQVFRTLVDYPDYLVSSQDLSAQLESALAENAPESEDGVIEALENLMPPSSNVRAVVLEYEGRYFWGGALSNADIEILSGEWFSQYLEAGGDHPSSLFYSTEVGTSSLYTILQLSMRSINGRDYCIAVFYAANQMVEQITELMETVYTSFLISDAISETPLVLYRNKEIGNFEPFLSQYDHGESASYRDASGHYYFFTVPSCGWVLGGFIDHITFNSDLYPFLLLLFLLCLVAGLLSFFLLTPYINRTLFPLQELEQAMKEVAEQGTDYYSPVQTDDEIGALSDVFNDMLDELRIREEEHVAQEKRELQLRNNLLFSQINSHFFFNTLQLIQTLSGQGKNEDVTLAVSSLADILHDCLQAQHSNMMDTVEHEKEIVDAYWAIEKLDPVNFGSLIWEIEKDLKNCMIPKNIIQPLVENALFHGLDDPETGEKHGQVTISIRQEDSQILITVSNTGNHVTEENLRKMNSGDSSKGRHIGISNIRKRLELLYGDQGSLLIHCDQDTHAEIRVPAHLSALLEQPVPDSIDLVGKIE